MVKKNIAALMLLLLIASANAQSVNKNFEVVNLTSQSNGKINAQMFIEKHSGLQGQQFGIVITNLTQHKLKITGTYTAKLTCGNQTNADINITLKPGETQGGKQYLMETSGLSATVFSESCKGNPVYENGTQVGYNRIKSVTYDITKITDLTEQEQQSSYQSDRQNNNDNTNIGSNNQSLYATNNAGYYKTDNTNTSNNSNNKKTSSLYNGTVTKTTTTTRTTNNAGNTYAQQFQQWQNNNAQTHQNVSNVIAAAGNQLQQQLQNNYEQKQQEMEEQHERNMQEIKAKQEQEEQERNERMQKEKQESFNKITAFQNEQRLAAEILPLEGTYTKPSYADNTPSLKSIYYVAFYRSENTVWLMKPIKIDKYSDDSWMSEEYFKGKISPLFPNTYSIASAEDMLHIIGYFTNEKEALAKYNIMLQNSRKVGCRTNIIESARPEDNKKAQQSPKDFWNN